MDIADKRQIQGADNAYISRLKEDLTFNGNQLVRLPTTSSELF